MQIALLGEKLAAAGRAREQAEKVIRMPVLCLCTWPGSLLECVAGTDSQFVLAWSVGDGCGDGREGGRAQVAH